MTRAHPWFLPRSPDVVGMLCEQAERTHQGMEAFAAWTQGDEDAADRVRELEHACDETRRSLVAGLREAFTTPVAPEDLFALSQSLDRVMNGAKNTVREAEAMQFPPDQPTAQMAALICEGIDHLRRACSHLDGHTDSAGTLATGAADAAIASQRRLERVYRQAMTDLADATELRVVIGSREMYRRLSAMSEDLVTVAERIWYARVKES